MCLTSHSLTLLTCNYLHHCILTISLCEIKGKMSKLPTKLKYCWNLKVMLKYFVRERKNTSFIKSKIVDNMPLNISFAKSNSNTFQSVIQIFPDSATTSFFMLPTFSLWRYIWYIHGDQNIKSVIYSETLLSNLNIDTWVILSELI